MKKVLSILAMILTAATLTACSGGSDTPAIATPEPAPTPDRELVKNTINATITLEDGDEILLELYPDLAPETVANFVELAEDGFYDGTIFHRVIEGFMIQGGGYNENLKEQKADTIKGEFAANGFENSLAHDRGVISMARTNMDMDSASSQFFIMQEYSPHLDGQYAAFGKVVDGLDVVDEIASVKTGAVAASGMQDVPIDPIVIESITIDDNSTSNSSKSSKNKKDKDDEDTDDDKTANSSKSSSSKSSPKPSSKSSSSKSSDSNELTEDELEGILSSMSSDSDI